MSWKLNKDCNILTPTLLAIVTFFPASAGSWFSLPEQEHWLQNLITNWLTSCRTRVISLFDIHLFPVSSQFALNSTRRQSRYPLISSTGLTCYSLWCISHLTVKPGRRSISYNSTPSEAKPGSLWTCGQMPSPAATPWVCHRPPDCTRGSLRSSEHLGTLWCWLSSRLRRYEVAWCGLRLTPHQRP